VPVAVQCQCAATSSCKSAKAPHKPGDGALDRHGQCQPEALAECLTSISANADQARCSDAASTRHTFQLLSPLLDADDRCTVEILGDWGFLRSDLMRSVLQQHVPPCDSLAGTVLVRAGSWCVQSTSAARAGEALYDEWQHPHAV
jgi:hypothetical protein